MSDTSSLQNISTGTFEEKLKNAVQNDITNKNYIMNYKNDAFSGWEKIVNNSNIWEQIVKKNSQYDVLYKANEKYSLDIMYVDGEIQYINNQIEKYKEHNNEVEALIKEAVVQLKEIEHEKEEVYKKLKYKHYCIKKATKYYKTLLNFYIRFEKEKDVFEATVCYFTQKFDDTYSFVMSKSDNEDKWTLNSIKPQLEEFQFMALQERFDSYNNMSSLLCTVRQILMMYKNSRN